MSSVVLQCLTSLLFVFISFPFGVTDKGMLLLRFSVLCSLIDILVQRYDMHGSSQ